MIFITNVVIAILNSVINVSNLYSFFRVNCHLKMEELREKIISREM